MDARTHWLWSDFADIAGSAVLRSQTAHNDPTIDWDRQKQALRTAGLAFACSVLEADNHKHNDGHTKVLFHLRNAVIHNGGDITLNHGAPKPYDECMDYLKNERWKELDSLIGSFFSIAPSGGITLEAKIFFFVKRLFWSCMSPGEQAKPAPG